MQRNIKMQHALGWSIKKSGSFLKHIVLVSKTVANSYIFKSKSVPLQCLHTANSLISSCRWIAETIFSNNWQNPQITAAVHYFQKQPPEVFCKKRCSWKVRKFHRKIPVLESVSTLLKWNSNTGVFLWNLQNF